MASVRDTVGSHEESEDLFTELRHHLGDRAGPEPRGAVWHACAEGAVDCEAFVILASRAAGGGRMRVYEMPAHRVASLVYRGDEDYLGAYRAIRAWLEAAAVAVVGPKREVFLEEGRGHTESVTEIQFPIGPPSEEIQQA